MHTTHGLTGEEESSRNNSSAIIIITHRPLRNTKHLPWLPAGVFILLFVQWMKFAVTETNGRPAVCRAQFSIVRGLNYILRPTV